MQIELNRNSIKEKWDEIGGELKSTHDYGVEKKKRIKEKYEKTLSTPLYLGMSKQIPIWNYHPKRQLMELKLFHLNQIQ